MNITFHPENGTVSYFQRKLWRFDEKMSNGSLDDVVVQLNVVAIVSKNKNPHLTHKERMSNFFCIQFKVFTN